MNFLKLREEKVGMEAQDVKLKPQISLKLYCKWLTDKFNKLKKEYLKLREMYQARGKEIERLKKQIDFINSNNKVVNNKYLNEKQEFQKELYKEDVIKSYQGKLKAQEHQIKCLREANNKLITENLKLKENE